MKLTIGTVAFEVPDTFSAAQFSEFLQSIMLLQDKLSAFVQAVTGQAPAAGTATATQPATAQLQSSSVAVL